MPSFISVLQLPLVGLARGSPSGRLACPLSSSSLSGPAGWSLLYFSALTLEPALSPEPRLLFFWRREFRNQHQGARRSLLPHCPLPLDALAGSTRRYIRVHTHGCLYFRNHSSVRSSGMGSSLAPDLIQSTQFILSCLILECTESGFRTANP